MSSAVLRGKVERNEDALTACFVDLLRIHDDRSLVNALLAASLVADSSGRATESSLRSWLADIEWSAFALELWPQWRSGEPDVILELFRDGRVVARVVIEAKAGALKGGAEADLASVTPVPPSSDQLAGYICDAVAASEAGTRVALVYLTHHAAMPREDLAESIAVCTRNGVAAPIAWCGWRDVEEGLVARAATPGAYGRAIRDAIALLRLYGYSRFRGGWRNGGAAVPSPRPRAWWRGPRVEAAPTRKPSVRTWSVARSVGPPPRVISYGGRSARRRTFRVGTDAVSALPAVVFHRTGVSRC